MTVNLTRIYTRLGDGGETHLGDMSRVPKTHPRIEAYGDIDELNAHSASRSTAEGLPERYAEWLRRVQNDLFDLGADLERARGRRAQAPARRARAGDVARAGVRRGQRDARAAEVLRPARRHAWPPRTCTSAAPSAGAPSAARCVVEDANPEVVRYLNRLSDLLFILSRGANAGDEPLWEPGRFRE